MPDLYVQVKNKIATNSKPVIPVCDNNDYVIIFDFDEEWKLLKTKTARFIYNKTYIDIIFDDNKCKVPIIKNINSFTVGVFGGNLHTTTPAYFRVNKSILSGTENMADLIEPNLYNAIMDKINQTVRYTKQDLLKEQQKQARNNLDFDFSESDDWLYDFLWSEGFIYGTLYSSDLSGIFIYDTTYFLIV